MAIAAFWTIRQYGKQLKVLVQQNLTQRTQRYPILYLGKFEFVENAMKVEVENIGDAPATFVGLETRFHAANTHLNDGPTADSNRITEAQARDMAAKGRTIYQSVDLETKPLKCEEGDARPAGVVLFLVNKQRANAMLIPKEKQEYFLDPLFLVKSTDKMGWWKTLTFIDAVALLRQNGFPYMSVSISLVGKTLAEERLRSEGITRFLVNLEEDKNLEQAFHKQKKPYFYPVAITETIRRGWMESELYDNIITDPGNFPPR